MITRRLSRSYASSAMPLASYSMIWKMLQRSRSSNAANAVDRAGRWATCGVSHSLIDSISSISD